MGDAYDYYDDSLDRLAAIESKRGRASRGYWRTAEGTEIHVEDMTDSHLLNAHRFAKRTKWLYEEELAHLRREIRRRGLRVLT